MAKTELQDIQILQSMINVQIEIEDLIDDAGGTVEDVVADDKVFKLVYFNTINLLYLTKNLSSKTKKGALNFMDDFKSNIVLENLSYCYPRISKEEIVRYAEEISNCDSQYALKEQHNLCVEKIEGK